MELLDKMFDKAFPDVLKKGDITAVKLHFGEMGSHAFIRPVFVRKIVEKIRERQARPFIADTNTLYKGNRQNSADHLENAIANGFGYACTRAPLIIADGLWGRDYRTIKVGLKHFKQVKIGSAFAEADSIVVLSHMTGHLASGFGCAIKNVAMGCASRAGKQQQHSSTKPDIDVDKCIACGKCVRICPEDAISLKEFPEKDLSKENPENVSADNASASIDKKKCVGCDECVTICPTQAIAIRWDGKNDIQEKMCEYALGATKGKRVGYINFLLNITPSCDCMPASDAYIVHDIGILASRDILALDKASTDLVQEQKGNPNSRLNDPSAKDKFADLWEVESSSHFSYSVEIGLGNKDYELVRIE